MRLKSKIQQLLGGFKGTRHYAHSYSQEGEDMVLRRYLPEDRKGFYVDIGAHHPERFSNTAFYYSQGWNGINIDADPQLMAEFTQKRSRDVNLAMGVGEQQAKMIFYVFNEKALNTFDEKLANKRAKTPPYEIIAKKTIQILPLSKILKKHMPKGRRIDLMAIDVEGRDLQVLKSNDWEQFRPRIVLVECLKVSNLMEVEKDPVARFLIKKGYEPVAKTYFSVVFKDKHEE